MLYADTSLLIKLYQISKFFFKSYMKIWYNLFNLLSLFNFCFCPIFMIGLPFQNILYQINVKVSISFKLFNLTSSNIIIKWKNRFYSIVSKTMNNYFNLIVFYKWMNNIKFKKLLNLQVYCIVKLFGN